MIRGAINIIVGETVTFSFSDLKIGVKPRDFTNRSIDFTTWCNEQFQTGSHSQAECFSLLSFHFQLTELWMG